MKLKDSRGFTLMEIMVVVGIMTLLMATIIISVNPARQISNTRNAQRMSNVGNIQGGINHYTLDTFGGYPSEIDGTLRMIGTATSSCDVVCGPDSLQVVTNTFTDDTSGSFSAGTFSNTQWNSGTGVVDLTSGGLTAQTGTYTSAVKDAGASQTWTTLNWVPSAPYNKELPNNRAAEAGYFAGNASMAGNMLLMHMNDASGIITDSSGTGSVGSPTAITYGQAGKLKTALSFNGATSNVQSPSTASLRLPNTGGSVALWIRPTVNLTQGNGMGIIRMPDYGPNLVGPGGYGLEIFRANPGGSQVLKAQLGYNSGLSNNSTATQTLLGTTNLVSGTWYHVALTWNAGTMTVFVNGVPDGTVARTGTATLSWANATAPLLIGHQYAAASVGTNSPFVWFNGLMDEVGIWNRTLSPAEVLDFYKRGAFKLRLQARTCDDSACSGETFIGPTNSSDYYDDLNNVGLTPPSFPLSNQATNQYFQYKAFFDTDTSSSGPELHSIAQANNGSGSAGTAGTEPTAAACINLAPKLTPTYLASIPFDPQVGSAAKTYYAVKKINSDGLTVRACSPELGKTIEVTQ